jgi:DNA polymerase-2
MDAKGFILQSSYRIQSQRPVVHLYGRLVNGESFLVRDGRVRPFFYTDPRAAESARRAGAHDVSSTDWQNFAGQSVCRVEVGVPPDVPAIRDALHKQGFATYEADVRFAVRYLIERNIRGGCRICGDATAGQDVDWIFDEPELSAAEVTVTPRVLSFDIETSPDASRLLAIALYGQDTSGELVDEVLVVDPDSRQMPDRAIGFVDERSALEAFCRRVRELDPDVLTGWNVIDFDLAVLGRIAARLRQPFLLGRDASPVRIREARGYFGSGQAQISGRLVLDGIDLVRGAFLRFDEYGLDAVAGQVLGEGKTLGNDVDDKAGEISRQHAEDLESFAFYARTDARLALQILEKLDLFRLAFARATLTGMSPDRVAASIASFDFLYLAELGKRQTVAPTVVSASGSSPQAGGAVFEPVTGMHELVWVFDFKSLYPSLMRTFNIDPLAYRGADKVTDADIRLVNGAGFCREHGILPRMLDELFPAREAAKRAGDETASQAIKILMNSFYGVLGTSACRFHNPDIANAITGQGRFFLNWTREWFEAAGYRVLYGDTDSVFVLSGADLDDADPEETLALGSRLAEHLTQELAAFISERWQVASRMELEFEKLYARLFLPSVRHGAAGARKRYAGVRVGENEAVEFVGMEVVRRDWTELAKNVQRELYGRLFSGAGVADYLKRVVTRLRAGELDDELIYRKGLRKSLESYVASTPPHVAAARKLPGPPPRIIAYMVTTAGPEPIAALEHEPDREHYVEKQLKPVAEPVLGALGLDFAQVIGDDRQLGLF